ncbi:P-loop NTPase family protein [Aggregatibacter actinomycetemcomitans]|uniref:Transport associated protein 11 n=1 Tax=Aggregatibacter actinomycetemcomitans TaxID=714 RepID=S4W8Z1_AGGAC|nr:ATPase, T2SS/T4P/T4SS family [Aggregatibacter actinomycetemcomitans]AGO88766.1 transport associated protein 11 [Aggregatibacter actinomycetemcomitans]KOE52048.1 ATPase [Aggregatibacter actinomycetemcomitans serotype b str. S23A]
MAINSSGDVSISLHANKLFGELLEGEAITEIAINRPGEIFFEQKGVWHYQDAPHITYDLCDSFARALAKYRGDYISDTKPILSAVLPTGERTQIILPPASERETISITVRKPNKSFLTWIITSTTAF